MAHDSFPRLAARTKNFTLGLPRSFVVSPDGMRVLFLRSNSGTSPSQSLWLYDVTSRVERELADPAALLAESDEQLTAEERARRRGRRPGRRGLEVRRRARGSRPGVPGRRR